MVSGALGGVLDVGLVVCALTLSFLAWRHPESSRPVRAWATGGAACLLLFGGTADVLPTDWSSPWVSVARNGLLLVGCCALLRSSFLDLPSQRIRSRIHGRNVRGRVRAG